MSHRRNTVLSVASMEKPTTTSSSNSNEGDGNEPIPSDGSSKKKKKSKKPFGSSRAVFAQSNTAWGKREDTYDYLLQTEDYSILKEHRQYPSYVPSTSVWQRMMTETSSASTRSRSAPPPSFTTIPESTSRGDLSEDMGAGDTAWNDDESRDGVGNVRDLNQSQNQLPPRLTPNAWKQRITLAKQQYEQQQRGMSKEVKEEMAVDKSGSNKEQQGGGGNPLQNIWQNLMNRPRLVSSKSEWKRLQKHAEHIETIHLRELLEDADRCDALYAVHDGVYLDYSRQRVNFDTMKFLFDLAEKQDLKGKIDAMVTGEKINFTEDRAVLHTALRADRSEIGTIIVDGMDVVQEVHDVLDQIKQFTEGVRSGKLRGYTGKRFRNIVSVGIGGSYLGPEFLHECLKTEPEGINAALGYNLRFLSNVDPVDVERTCADLDPEETLIVVVSKTFTTAETMLNARTMRQWLWDFMGDDKEVVRMHVVACASTSAVEQVKNFGIDPQTGLFRFWDCIGGRYSVCSAAGAVPISLLYGFDLFEKFLKGANSIDKHFVTAPFDQNIPVLMGLLGVWNMSFLNYRSRTTLPYAEALLKLPAHIQQLDMESNGKYMTKQGLEVDYPVGEIDFGEAGTNGQHSFYQLLHMGQTVPCDFIGFVQSQHDFCLDDESLSSHDELMANFFAQPDALANGKTADEVRAEGVSEDILPHRVFKGNRPSLSLLLPKLTAYACGQLLAIYEHRTVVQGFLWDINSFDQWGVELGKKLAIEVKDHLMEARQKASNGDDPYVDTGRPATTRLLNYYIENSPDNCLVDEDCSNTIPENSYTQVTRKTHRDHHPQRPTPPVT
jgi:glucose-6-phosphate isomerase